MPQVSPIRISVINASTVISDDEARPVVQALQKQVTNDFRAAWGVDAELTFVPTGNEPRPKTWWLSILDDSDQAGALGYHDLTPDGLPIGKVFAATDLKYGDIWSVTASHELLEMLGDPNINLTVLVQSSDTAGTLYAYEVSDACEADDYGYMVGDIKVSDFVFPAWFENFRTTDSTQFDQGQYIHNPLELLPGGYIGAFDISSGSGWHQVTAEKKLARSIHRGNVGSRRERRGVPRSQWVPSLAHEHIMRNREKYLRSVMEIGRRRTATAKAAA